MKILDRTDGTPETYMFNVYDNFIGKKVVLILSNGNEMIGTLEAYNGSVIKLVYTGTVEKWDTYISPINVIAIQERIKI